MKVKGFEWFRRLRKDAPYKPTKERVEAALKQLKGNADFVYVISLFIGTRLSRAHTTMLSKSATTEVVIEAARNVRLLSKIMDELGLLDISDERD